MARARASRQSWVVVEMEMHPETPWAAAAARTCGTRPRKSAKVRWQWVSITPNRSGLGGGGGRRMLTPWRAQHCRGEWRI